MMKGIDQKVYFNDDLMATLTQADATLSIDFEDVNVCGDPATQHEMSSYSIEGTLTWKKSDSRVLELYADAVQKGYAPELVITGVNLQQQSGATECVTILNAQISEMKLFNAEAGSLVEEEIPFVASKFKVESTVKHTPIKKA